MVIQNDWVAKARDVEFLPKWRCRSGAIYRNPRFIEHLKNSPVKIVGGLDVVVGADVTAGVRWQYFRIEFVNSIKNKFRYYLDGGT